MFVYIGFFDSIFYNSCNKVVSQPFRSREHTYHGDLSSAFRGAKESYRDLPPCIASQLILVQNNNMSLCGILGPVYSWL